MSQSFKIDTDGKTDAEIGREIEAHLAEDFDGNLKGIEEEYNTERERIEAEYASSVEKGDAGSAKAARFYALAGLESARSASIQLVLMHLGGHAVAISGGDPETTKRYAEAAQFENSVMADLDQIETLPTAIEPGNTDRPL